MRALDLAGATLTRAAERLAEALDAEETKYFPQLAYPDRETGEPVIPHRTVIDHGHRLDAAKEAFKIMGAYQQGAKDETDPPVGPIVAIYFTTREPANAAPTDHRGAMLDFAPRCSGNGVSE